MSDKINVLSYSEYEKSVYDMGEGDRRIFQFLKSFAKPGVKHPQGCERFSDDLPVLNELVSLPTAHSVLFNEKVRKNEDTSLSGDRVLNELVEPYTKETNLSDSYGPVGVNTYSYLATMKSLTGTAYDLRHSERMAGQDAPNGAYDLPHSAGEWGQDAPKGAYDNKYEEEHKK